MPSVHVISDGPLEGNAPHVRRLLGWPTLQRIQWWVWGCLSVPSMSFEKLGIMGKLMERCDSVASLPRGLWGPISYWESGLGKKFGRATEIVLLSYDIWERKKWAISFRWYKSISGSQLFRPALKIRGRVGETVGHVTKENNFGFLWLSSHDLFSLLVSFLAASYMTTCIHQSHAWANRSGIGILPCYDYRNTTTWCWWCPSLEANHYQAARASDVKDMLWWWGMQEVY